MMKIVWYMPVSIRYPIDFAGLRERARFDQVDPQYNDRALKGPAGVTGMFYDRLLLVEPDPGADWISVVRNLEESGLELPNSEHLFVCADRFFPGLGWRIVCMSVQSLTACGEHTLGILANQDGKRALGSHPTKSFQVKTTGDLMMAIGRGSLGPRQWPIPLESIFHGICKQPAAV